MARTALVKTVAKGNDVSAGIKVTLAAADVANKNSFTLGSGDLVLAFNTDAALAHNVTITSVADAMGRVGDITAVAIAAGECFVFGPFKGPGWRQADGGLYLEADNATIKFGVVQLP